MQRRSECQQKALYRLIHVALTLTVAAIPIALACQATRAETVPQLNYMTQKGLNIQKNPIDRLLHTSGVACNSNPKYAIRCPFDKAFVKYLKTLPASRDDIAREIVALGGKCENGAAQLNCVYEREVEMTAYLVGASEPSSVVDNYFTIEFQISGETDNLQYTAKLTRVEKRRTSNRDNRDI